MKSIELLKKRRSDFYTGIVILAVAIAMLLESFTFPMQESYAGVQNVWYVSPALLPILVSGLLILLSVILIRKAIIDGGMQQAIEDFPNISKAMKSENFVRFFIITIYLEAYVYGLIPNSDFFICSMVFLMAFILPFYLDRNELFAISFWPFSISALLIGIVSHLSMISTWSIDIILILNMAFISISSWLKVRSDNELVAKWRITLWTSILTPLFLIPAFKFGLLVPLPTEGIIIKLMESIVH
jgi:hypothetical protein